MTVTVNEISRGVGYQEVSRSRIVETPKIGTILRRRILLHLLLLNHQKIIKVS